MIRDERRDVDGVHAVAVDEEEVVTGKKFTHGKEGAARAEEFVSLIAPENEGRAIASPTDEVAHGVGGMVQVDDGLDDTCIREGVEDAIEDRLANERERRLGDAIGERAEARGLAGGEYHGFHGGIVPKPRGAGQPSWSQSPTSGMMRA